MALSPRIVLVRTLYSRNVGSVSRAMTNMGSENLILVDPKCSLDFEAQQAAARGQGPLQNLVRHSCWKAFFESEPGGIYLGFTNRPGKARLPQPAQDVFQGLCHGLGHFHDKAKREHQLPVYMIFGPEDCGLSDRDLDFMHFRVTLPTYGANNSLNLAQAVLLALYLFREKNGAALGLTNNSIPSNTGRGKSRTEVVDEMLKRWIEELGFDLSKRRINAYMVMKRMILHSVPTDKEFRILSAVLEQNIRKLKEWRRLKSPPEN